MANSKLQMFIDCLRVRGDSMPLEVTSVYSQILENVEDALKTVDPLMSV